jgi:hypothetical protein
MRDRSCTPVHLAILSDRGHNASMARPGPKPKTLDVNQMAAAILEAVTGEPVGPTPKEDTGPAKDPAAVALGGQNASKNSISGTHIMRKSDLH